MKKFSIVIPTFNSERHIAETVQSALSQTGGSVEVVIDDNTSKDNTKSILKSFTDERLKVFANSEDLNIPNGWNRAMQHASGDFRLLLHSDNLLHPKFLETIRYFQEKFDFDAVYSECIYFEDDSKNFSWDQSVDHIKIPFTLLSPGERTVNYVFRFQRMIPTSCLAIKWDLLKERVPYLPKYEWDPDIELMNFLATNGTILHIRFPLCAIRTHQGQVSSWKQPRFSKQYFDLLQTSHEQGKTEAILFLRNWAGSNYDVCQKLAFSKAPWNYFLKYLLKWNSAELQIPKYTLWERLQKWKWMCQLVLRRCFG